MGREPPRGSPHRQPVRAPGAPEPAHSPRGATGARRHVGAVVKRLRQQRQFNLDTVCRAMQWSTSKLVRIEAGIIAISANDLRCLLRFYGIPDDDAAVAPLYEIARLARQRHWAATYRPRVSPAYMDVLGYEDYASRIAVFDPLVIPEILQTPAYATALASTILSNDTPEEIAAHVQVRMARQKHVRARAGAAELVVAIDEAVLQRAVGGREVMREQVEHLRAAGAVGGGFRLVIVALSSVIYPLVLYPFGVMEFTVASEPLVAWCRAGRADVAVIHDPDTVEFHQWAMRQIVEGAMSDADAAECLTSLLTTRYAPRPRS